MRPILLALVLALGGCATVDFDAPKPASEALTDTGDTYLGELLAETFHRPRDESGFYIVTDPIDALAIRLLLAERAQRSIDAQYYMIKGDVIGNVFFQTLLRAADRGVRVRLLIDDINTAGMDEVLGGMAEHPNIELRLFNPFANRSLRAFDAWNFGRINRRMHNKSFTVDNQVTVIGGRNIAAEYFSYNMEYNFGDLDTFAVGPVVRETSRMFDSYWNHRNAIPFQQLSGQQEDNGERLQTARDALVDSFDDLRNSPYSEAVRKSLEDFIDPDTRPLVWAPYELVYDSPDKSLSAREAKEAPSIVTPLVRSVTSAEESLLVVSPYFVPRKTGIETLAKMQVDGVDILIVTNSLASSDHTLVHGGYTAYRKRLLKSGIRICEIRGDLYIPGTEDAGSYDTKSSLHTKAFIVDRRYFFMGSFNWDPRSANINTELGIIIESPEIAERLSTAMEEALENVCYMPFLDERGRLRWREHNGDQVDILTHEPDTTYFHRVKATLSRALPVRGQL
jgi:putative cardiolipin synthase